MQRIWVSLLYKSSNNDKNEYLLDVDVLLVKEQSVIDFMKLLLHLMNYFLNKIFFS